MPRPPAKAVHAARIAAIALAILCARPAAAAEATVSGAEMAGYGRFVFTLDKPVRSQVRSTSGVIVLSFDEPVSVDVDRVAAQMSSYVSVVRRDPDGRTVRFATKRALRTNLLEAGEKIFLDLMPESWQGLPPSLPQEVVEGLARRARDAEEHLRKTQRERERREIRDLAARVGTGPTFTRVIFDIGQTVPVEIAKEGDRLTLVFDAALHLDAARLKAELPPAVKALTAQTAAGLLTVAIEAPGAEMRAFREDDTVIVDFPKPRDPTREADVVLPSLTRPATASAALQPATAEPEPRRTAAPPPIRAVSDAAAPVRPRLTRVGEGIEVHLPFPGQAPAAAFLRDDVLWMVFDAKERVEAAPVPSDLAGEILRLDVDRAAGAAIVRLTLRQPQAVGFAPAEGGGWTASLGRAGGRPTESLLLRRGVAEDGRTILTTRLPALGPIIWLDDPDTGDRLGVVTARGPAYGLPKAQTFVELAALPTAHGLAIQPRTDDVVVTVGLDEVRISRDGGLNVSLGVPDGRAPAGAEKGQTLLIDAEAWREANRGDIRVKGNELLRAAADAPKKDRTEARLKLAQFRLATGDAVEAAGILKVVEGDDPSAVATKPMLLQRAIAAIETGDLKEAARLLSEPPIAAEPETGLWRGVMEAKAERWTPALVALRQAGEVLDRYPPELETRIRGLLVRAAIETGEAGLASQQLDLFERGQTDPDGGLVSLHRGRIAELQNRRDDAFQAYDDAVRAKDRGVEAEARLRRTLLKLVHAKIGRDAALVELETIGMMWRRGETEVQALFALGEMYAADDRWRDAFSAARRTTEIRPDHPLSRRLHDAMAKRFEELFLEGKADRLSKVEAVGLFYDFRNLMPISRRGDEIVRRLADRLADLDLLDQASELLQHQVDNRLGGIQRARVAARLAVLHLLNRKPAQAVRTLTATRAADLPEEVRRGRVILEARALSELSRIDLALEMLAGLSGADVDRLRADVLWRGKRWRDAGESIEKVLGERWRGTDELSDVERADVMRAGVAYVLADDRLALDRLRQKYAAKMADSVDARPFALVSADSAARPREFRDVARGVVAEETLSEFLNVYRQRYPETAGAPRNPRAAEEAVKERMGQQGEAKAGQQPG